MKIAYFVNQYPAVSHSFIRREILALEKIGIQVSRIALRVDVDSLVDQGDRDELSRTQYILSLNKISILLTVLEYLICHPILGLRSAIASFRLGLNSERGIFKHLAYFVEAVVLNSWVREKNIKHVHAHFGTNSTTVAMLASMLGGVQYSFTVHGPEEFDKPDYIHLSEKIRRAKFVVAITSFCRSQLFRQVTSEYWPKIKIVRCGLDQYFLENPTIVEEVDENVFVCIGRLCEQKGQILLIEALRDVLQGGASAKLILAGDGPMRKEIEQKIEHYGLGDSVKITGWISGEEVKKYLASCKAMVLPSFAEGLPVVIMEALAMRKPVITTYIAGIPELIENGIEGWLIPAGSRQDLTRALLKAINTEADTYKKMGESGYLKVAEYHNIDKESQRLAQHLRGALQ